MQLQCHVYLTTEALSHANEWSGSGGPSVHGYGGPSVVMLSAVDGPPGPSHTVSVAAVHGPRGPSMAAALGPGGPVTRYLVRVHKWSGRIKYYDIICPTRTIYVVISGPPKT